MPLNNIITKWNKVHVDFNTQKWTRLEVELRQTEKGPELSICGSHGNGPHPSDRSITRCGQIPELLAAVFPEVISHLPWHLNSMNAGCIHQDGWTICPGHTGNSEPCPGGRKLNAAEKIHYRIDSPYPCRWRCTADKIGHPCPECGYRFGTAWLYRPLPQATLDWVMAGPFPDLNQQQTEGGAK